MFARADARCQRCELYRVRRPPGDPKPARTFTVVSRQALIDSTYTTVVCAPVFSERHGLPTQVPIGPPEGSKYDSAIQAPCGFPETRDRGISGGRRLLREAPHGVCRRYHVSSNSPRL